MEPLILDAPACMLGESPMWNAGRGSAFWVDILGNAIFEYNLDDGRISRYAGSRMISLVCPVCDQNGMLVAGAQGGIGVYDLSSHTLSIISDLNRNWEHHRCNDGAVDRLGNLWIGTTHVDHEPEAGDLYRVSEDWCAAKKIERVTISNGICWSADHKTMFYIDTPTREIRAFHCSAAGVLTFDRVAAKIPASMGYPDGMAMDAAGTIWVAIWGGCGVGGFNSLTGVMEHWISLPVPQVSSCAFVGSKLDHLLITTARKEMDNQQLADYPDSGHTFLAKMDVPGLPTYDCRLPIRLP